LASGSKGNAIYISNGETSVLLDAGLSGVEIERRLKSRGLSPEKLDAIIVSHEHSDHVHGVGVLSRRYSLPVYMNSKTSKAAVPVLGNLQDQCFFECGSPFRVKTLTLHPFSVSHDAQDPAGFTIYQNGTKVGIATDLGFATSMVKEHLKNCNLLIVEANHDPVMLIDGPYPWPLKQRIKSRSGHLSNQDTKVLLQELKHDCLEHVILAHLSETNNTPQKALSEVGQAVSGCKIRLTLATQNDCGSLFQLI
jgi:phosphoribosyl 1,2-cyclic phosphodiesterase